MGNDFMEEDREMEPPMKLVRATPPIIEGADILMAKMSNLSVGDIISINTIEKVAHGIVEHKSSKTVRILEFLSDEGTAQGPDVNIKTFHLENIQDITKETDPERLMTPARKMDLPWVLKNRKNDNFKICKI